MGFTVIRWLWLQRYQGDYIFILGQGTHGAFDLYAHTELPPTWKLKSEVSVQLDLQALSGGQQGFELECWESTMLNDQQMTRNMNAMLGCIG